jgi:hypothetical protein
MGVFFGGGVLVVRYERKQVVLSLFYKPPPYKAYTKQN